MCSLFFLYTRKNVEDEVQLLNGIMRDVKKCNINKSICVMNLHYLMYTNFTLTRFCLVSQKKKGEQTWIQVQILYCHKGKKEGK